MITAGAIAVCLGFVLVPSAAPFAEEAGDDERMAALEARIEELEAKLAAAEQPAFDQPALVINGFADFGFFVPVGSGAGVVRDVRGDTDLSDRYGWVFYGDLLSTAVNSRGEAASLGELPGVDRFDSVDSKGAASFLLNEVSLGLRAGLRDELFFNSSINFVPRSGSEFSLGDFVELELAEIEWSILGDHRTKLYAGKVAPVLGVEYRRRKAVDRFGVTPSLIARYTSGTQLGVKARVRLFDEALILTAAVTNGSSVIEQFHFAREVDANDGKTVSGRAAFRVPLGRFVAAAAGELEVGVSAQWGPQDVARDNGGALWFAGADLQYSGVELQVRAELLTGRAPGQPIDLAYLLELKSGGYLEIDYLLFPEVGLIARAEFRDALVALGSERVYLSKTWRVVGGAKAIITPNLAIKAEYLHNGEFGELPAIANDVFTSSLVLSF